MATFSSPSANAALFFHAAMSPSLRRRMLDLSCTGFAAFTACSLLLGSSLSATADEAATTGNTKVAAKPALAQIGMVKTAPTKSLLSQATATPIHILRPLSTTARYNNAQRYAEAAPAQTAPATIDEDTPAVMALPDSPPPADTSQETAPVAQPAAASETQPAPVTETVTAQTEAPATAQTAQPDTSGQQPPAAATQTARLYAPSISYEGGVIVAQGTEEDPVRLESDQARIIAQNVRLDTENKTVSARGKVRVERQVTTKRYSAFRTRGDEDEINEETVTETLTGEDFDYNFNTRQGKLGATSVRLANFNISAESLTINGQVYTARNVIVRPGGLSEEELKIYGTPPFNLRAREFIVDASKPAVSNANSSDDGRDESVAGFSARTYAKGAGLYFKNTRILPVPSALLSRRLGRREQATYQITPRIYFNSSDGLLVTTRVYFPLSKDNPDRLNLTTDIGLSTKVGFRGGAELESNNKFGRFRLGARVNDVVVSQLTNRIELDRLPEFDYRSPGLGLFNLPGGRKAGLRLGFTAGDYREKFSNGNYRTKGSRLQGQVRFTTRLAREDGPYLELFARAAKYSNHFENLNSAGYEIGYAGPITSRIAGQFSYSATNISGSTPFRFDEVEIRKELRATFDVMLTPRYLVPIDLRYDVERGELRDTTFGILRNYKTFAYGVTYQSARNELRFEIRQGF